MRNGRISLIIKGVGLFYIYLIQNNLISSLIDSRGGEVPSTDLHVNDTLDQRNHTLGRQSSSISSFTRLFGPSVSPTSSNSSTNDPNATASPTPERQSFGNLVNGNPPIITNQSSGALLSPMDNNVPLSIAIPLGAPIDRAPRLATDVESNIPHLPLIGEDHDELDSILDIIASIQRGPISVPIVDTERASTTGPSSMSSSLMSFVVPSCQRLVRSR